MSQKRTEAQPERLEAFNPLDKKQLALSVANALLSSPLQDLPPAHRFAGAGVYAIYYSGPSSHYRKMVEIHDGSPNGFPIYIGKAIPLGGRRGIEESDPSIGVSLYRRLKDHADSIEQTDLRLDHFKCRYLAVDEIWIPLAESLLIRTLKPLWNVVIDGFGNHDPGSGRYKQKISPWDILHTGRSWAAKLSKGAKSQQQLLGAIEKHLESPHFSPQKLESGNE